MVSINNNYHIKEYLKEKLIQKKGENAIVDSFIKYLGLSTQNVFNGTDFYECAINGFNGLYNQEKLGRLFKCVAEIDGIPMPWYYDVIGLLGIKLAVVISKNDILIRDTLGSSYEEIAKQFPYLNYDSAETFIKVSDYNKIAKLYGLDQVHLNNNEYIIIADFDSWVNIRNQSLKNNTSITLNDVTLTPKYDECVNGFIYMTSSHINTGVFVVPDNAVNNIEKETGIMVANYNANTDEEKQEIEDMIIATENSPYASSTTIEASTKISLYESSIGLGAMITFIGLYLGIIFLIASAAILALKELSESTDNKERFNMLRKIGTDEKMLNKALFRQIGIFFLFPLILAIIHSIFGIKFCAYLLETFGKDELIKSIIVTAGVIVFIYGGYFLITYLCSKNIIKER